MKDIVIAVLRALKISDTMCGSQMDFMQILEYGRDLYCKGDSEMLAKWPSSINACMKLLKSAGYKDPSTYYICLDKSHPGLWSIMEKADSICKYCSKCGTINYHYLPLVDKVNRWCSSADFCEKMTAHWRNWSHWLTGSQHSVNKSEIWDGDRFSELKWFWDPSANWILPTRCVTCYNVISLNDEGTQACNDTINITCPHCYTSFEHVPKYTSGDPRNIALIGHWDGWQPFSTSL